jgi:glycosyltransferase involved in cell wall biosynthesis
LQPKLSIVTINYNNSHGLQQTIDAVINQSFNSYEYIVIDGGSSDDSKTIIEKYADKISYWVSEKDNGVYHAMNKGIAKANGEYVLFLNSGDYFITNTILEKIFAEKNTEDILYGDVQTPTEILRYPEKLDFFYFFRYSLGHPASFIKKSLFEKYGFYNEENKIVSDWEFFLKVIVTHKASYKYLKEVVSYFDTTGMSSSVESQVLLNEEMIKVLHPYLDEYYSEIIIGCNELRDKISYYQKKEFRRTLKYYISKIFKVKNP